MSRRGGFYEVLGVAADASTETIRDAYRERVKEVHPDRSDAPDAAERFKRVTRAKEVLTDPQERARYDRLGHEAYVGRTFWSGSGEDRESTGSGSTGNRNRRRRAERRRRETQAGQTSGSGRRQNRGAGRERSRGRDQAGRGSRGREQPGQGSAAGEPGSTSGSGPAGATRTDAGGSTRGPGDGPGGGRPDGGARATGHGRAGDHARGHQRSRGGRSRRETRTSEGIRSNRERGWRGHGSGANGGWAGVSGRAGEQYGADWYASGASTGTGSDISPGGRLGLGPVHVGLAAVAFVLYPLLAAGSFAPWFPAAINAAIGLLGLVLVVALIWTPEAGALAFGGWTVLAPAVLVATGVGVFSLAGVLVWSACWIPFVLSLLGLVFRHP